MKVLILFLIAIAAWGQIPLPGGGSGGGGSTATCGSVPGELCFNKAGAFAGLTGSAVTDDKDANDYYFRLNPQTPTSVSGAVGTAGNPVLLKGADGGTSTNASGEGGEGGSVDRRGGAGGTATGTTDPVGGLAGSIIDTAGAGASVTTGTVSNTGGDGGDRNNSAGAGGNASHANAANSGGDGGGAALNAGSGGGADGSGTSVNIGGTGGDASLVAGPGGNTANGATNTGGLGGTVVLQPGDGGSGTAPASDGTVRIVLGGNANANFTEWRDSSNVLRLAVDHAGSLIGQPANAPAISGCTAAAIGANSTGLVGTITGTPTGACAVTITFDSTAAHGWTCGPILANVTRGNITNALFYTSTTGTTVVYTGTTVANDVLIYGPCVGY